MIKKIIALILILTLLTPQNVFAQILPDGTTMTGVDYSTLNKTPVLNIAAPNAKGISHNKFTEYNVGANNLIINNTKQDGLESKLGGYIAGNSNLIRANKEAEIILNEITSNKRTALNGYTEILGKRAELIIANPNGISISGAGFINTSRLTLITGAPNADLTSFNLSQRSSIQVSGRNTESTANLGLDGAALDGVDFITRTLILGGDIYSPEINILTGNGSFDFNTKQVSSIEIPALAAEFAVDASAMGGMYGGRINIVGTEKGFGVRSLGNMVADLDDITITNAGDVEYKRALAQRDIKVNSSAVFKSTESLANNNIDIKAETAEYETLRAGQKINITADTVNHLNNAEAGGDINIKARELNVLNFLYPASLDNVMLAYGNINLDAAHINNESEIAAYKNVNITSSILNNNSLILANQNLNITGGDIFNNPGAVLYATDTLNIKTDGAVYNLQGNILGSGGVYVAGLTSARAALFNNIAGSVESSKGDISIFAQGINNLSIDNCDPSKETCHTYVLIDTGERASYTQGIKLVTKYRADVLSHLEALSYGTITANKKLTLNAGEILNISSRMAAGELFEAQGDIFRNESSNYLAIVRDILEEAYKKKCGGGSKYCYRTREIEGGLYGLVVYSQTGASVSAPIINITAALFGNGTTDNDPLLPWASTPVNQRLEDARASGVIDPLALGILPEGGMFKAASPDSKYLFVTDNRFLNIYDFVGSNYFEELMGFRPDKDGAKWLGDPVYEQRLIEKAVLDITGNHYLYDGVTDINDQMSRLYNNAFDAYNSGLGLEIGKALTAEQIAALTDNIVWYVEAEINGQLALVPTLYIAESNKDKFLNGSASTVKGSELNINATDIYNSGELSGNIVELYASNDITNISGTISGAEYVALNAGNDILIETKLNSYSSGPNGTTYGAVEGYNYEGTGITRSWLGPAGGVYSGGNIDMKAGGDITLKAAELMSDGDTSLAAAGNVNIGVQTLDNSQWRSASDRHYEQTEITNIGSYLETIGSLNITSGADTTVQGSALISEEDINIKGANVNIVSAVDSSHTYHRNESSNLYSSQLNEHLVDSSTHMGSSVNAYGNININADNDINIIASSLGGWGGQGEGDINLTAGENVNILAGVNSYAAMDNRETSSMFGLEAKQDKVYDKVTTLEAGSVFSDKDLNIKSGADTLIFASDIGAQGEGDIETGGNLNVLAGKETNYHYEYHMERNFDIFETMGDIIVDLAEKVAASQFLANPLTIGVGVYMIKDDLEDAWDTGRFEVAGADLGTIDAYTTESYNETVRGSTLNFGGSLNTKSGGDANIVASTIFADEAEIKATNINVLDMQAESWSRSSERHLELELSAGINVPGYSLMKSAENVYDKGEDVIKQMEQIKANDTSNLEHKEQGYIGLAVDVFDLLNSLSGLGGGWSGLKDKESGKYKSIQQDLANYLPFYGRLDVDGSSAESHSESSQSVGSVIETMGNLTFKSSEETTQKGSAALSHEGDITYEALGGANIIAGESSFKTETEGLQYHGALQINTDLTRVGAEAEYNQQSTQTYTEGLQHTNSAVYAENGKITIKTEADVTVKGANIYGEEVEILSKNLTVETVQDTNYHTERSEGFNANVTGGPGGFGAGGGYNYSKTDGNAEWTNNQTGIIAKEKMDIEVEEKTTLEGAVIASQTGDLTLKTKELDYKDVYGHDEEETVGYSVGANAGASPSGEVNPDSITGSLKLEGYDKEQVARATLGEGSIIINGAEAPNEELKDLNRDITNTLETTKDVRTNDFDEDVSVSYKWITDFKGQLENIGFVFTESWDLTKTGVDFVAAQLIELFGDSAEEVINKSNLPEEKKEAIKAAIKRNREIKARDAKRLIDRLEELEHKDRAAAREKELDTATRLQIIDTMTEDERKKLVSTLNPEIAEKISELEREKGRALFANEKDDAIRSVIAENLPKDLVEKKGKEYIAKYNAANSQMVILGPEIEELTEKVNDEKDPAKKELLKKELSDKNVEYELAILTVKTYMNIAPVDPIFAAKAIAINKTLNSDDVLGIFATPGRTSASSTFSQEIESLVGRKFNAAGLKDIAFELTTNANYPGKADTAAYYDPNTKKIYLNTSALDFNYNGFEDVNSLINHEIKHALDAKAIEDYFKNIKGKTAAEQKAMFNALDSYTKLLVGDEMIYTKDELYKKIYGDNFKMMAMTERWADIAGASRTIHNIQGTEK